jgi:hypothetical protein
MLNSPWKWQGAPAGQLTTFVYMTAMAASRPQIGTAVTAAPACAQQNFTLEWIAVTARGNSRRTRSTIAIEYQWNHGTTRQR